jgi:parallel beta-helix repeat protein
MHRRAALLVLVSILLFSSLVVLTLNVPVVNGAGTIYIRADGSIDPPTANITSTDNVTYTLTGNINDFIVVERNNIVLDGAGYMVQGPDSGNGITLSGRTNVTIENTTIFHHEVGIFIGQSSYINVVGNNLTYDWETAITVLTSSYSSIIGNNITDFSRGIWVDGSSHNNITGNIIDHSLARNLQYEGIEIYGSSNYITENNIHDFQNGIRLSLSSDNDISGNNITKNGVGIYIYSSASYNSITGNNITNNNGWGIKLESSSNQSISGNNITNSYEGPGEGLAFVSLSSSSGNTFYHNNFIGYEYSLVQSDGSPNTWDNHYPSGGNYWSDYSSADNYSGSYQNETGSDGIGDVALEIDQYNRDNYPLMSPWPRHEIAIINITLSANEAYTGQTIHINVAIKNWGGLPETFSVTAYCDDTTIETQEISGLTPDMKTDLIFDWNTADVSGGYYAISADTSSIAGEIYTADNAFVNGVIKITSPVRIIEVIPCNQTGAAKDTFQRGTLAFFKVTLNSTALIPQSTLITINLYDNSSITIGVASIQGPLFPGTSTYIFGLAIPTWAEIGTATVYANCYTDWPSQGGFPHCPEVSATIEITGP